MARKKMIEDDVLFGLIEKYHRLNCVYNNTKIKLPQLVEFIGRNGYPDYRIESLRRNEKARAHIESLNRTTVSRKTPLARDVHSALRN